MQKAFHRVLGIPVSYVVVLVLSVPCSLRAAHIEKIISFSGQTLTSIFDGLKPSEFSAGSYEETVKRCTGTGWNERLWPEMEWKGQHLAKLRMTCSICPGDTVCAGHYEVLQDSSGCIDPLGACPLPLNNAHTDTTNGLYDDGSYDTYCGQYCCLDAYLCNNP